MKKFIFKISIFFFVGIVNIFMLMMYYGAFKKHEKLNFISNSISLNAKSAFIYKNKSKLKKANLIILGSSMSLNNIDGGYLETLTNEEIINLSSWSMKIVDLKEFLPHINPNSNIIINISFTDFGQTWIERYSHFPLGGQKEYFNILSNLRTFEQQVSQIEHYTADSSNRDYTSLNFDNTGSVLLFKKNFHISPKKWDDFKYPPSVVEIENFIDQLDFFEKRKVYIFFSPERAKYKTKNKYKILSRLETELKKKFRNVRFFNNYKQNYSDSMFVDCYHFNDIGAKKYSELIYEQMKSYLGS